MALSSPERLHALDFVRGTALFLGIVFHAGLAFYPTETPVWLIMDTQRSNAISWVGFTTHLFRMTTFFLLAGYFGRMVLERRGAGWFIRSRLKRIAAPLLIFWPLMMMAFTWLMVWALNKQFGLTTDQMPPPPPMTAETFPWTHLWFLYLLLGFYAAMLLLRLPLVIIDRNDHWRSAASSGLRGILGSPLSPIALAIPVAIALLTQPNWIEWFGVPTPDTGVVPNTVGLLTYGIAFSLGWFIRRADPQLRTITQHTVLNIISGAGAVAICFFLLDGHPTAAPVLEGREKMVFAAAYALAVWYLTFAFIGMATRVFASPNRVTRYIADSSYWVYIVHLPIVLGLQVWIYDKAWPPLGKFGLIILGTIVLSLVSYQLLVRHSFIGNLLNGPKKKAG